MWKDITKMSRVMEYKPHALFGIIVPISVTKLNSIFSGFWQIGQLSLFIPEELICVNVTDKLPTCPPW